MGAVLVHEPDADARLSSEAEHLQQRVAEAEQELRLFTGEHAQRITSLGPREWMAHDADVLEQERLRTGTLVKAMLADSTVAWSGDQVNEAQDSTCVYLHSEVAVGLLRVRATRPVWTEPRVQNRYLFAGYHPSMRAPRALIAVGSNRPGIDVVQSDGSVLLRAAWLEGAMELGTWLWWRAALMVASVFFFIGALWSFCLRLVGRGWRWRGVVLFLAVMVSMRWITIALGHFAPFDRWPLFDPSIYAAGWWFPSLGDMLINAALIALGALFLLRSARDSGRVSSPWAVFLLVGSWLAMAAWVTRLIIGLVSDSTLDLDLFRIQDIGAYGMVSLLVSALLMGAWCLTVLAGMRVLTPLPSSSGMAAPCVIAMAVSVILHHLFGVRDTVLFLWPMAALLIFLSGRRSSFGFLRGVLLLAILSGTTTHVITRHMAQRERNERSALADRLALREDPYLDQLFRETAPAIRRDAGLYRLFTSSGYCEANELERQVRQPYFSGYWERFELRLFAYDTLGVLRCATDQEGPRDLLSDTSEFPVGVADMPDLFADERLGGDLFYHARIAIMPTDSTPPAQLIIELKPRSLSQGVGFPDLLVAGQDKWEKRAEQYAQARYVNGLLMDQRGPVAMNQRWNRPLSDETWYEEQGQDYLAKKVSDNVVMVLGLPHRSTADRITTFSYLFTLFGLLMLIALGAHATIGGTLPDLGIGTKVRAALVLFAITGLVFFGIGSQRLLTHQFQEREEAMSLEKARSVAQELRRRIGDERIERAEYTGHLQYMLSQLSNSYVTDLTLYAPDGRWLSSSRPQMLTSGLLGPRMDHNAYARLAIRGETSFVHQESVGSARFRTAYMPVLDSRGATLAYLALPSFADQARQTEERAQLLVAVVNLFVLLFSLSVLLAVFISNWTTRPLDALKRALASVALRGSNQPIQYRGKDEVGELVAVYNQKVEELRESAERLARSERETAWREMARQVAHEVKNPLTPMKLGIQHFQYTFDAKAPDAKERLDRFTKSMVEQIDTLNGVASAFSQFAQMPAAAPTELDFCEVVRAAVDVFHASPGITIAHEEDGPLPVLADREHMLRVLNNLLKNAVQAIPEEHEGRIAVIARRAGSWARIEVHDNGTGIPEEARERIFTPSFTTKSSGMGLGLAMVKRMVEQAGGRVWFETEEGLGTRFFVELPLVR